MGGRIIARATSDFHLIGPSEAHPPRISVQHLVSRHDPHNLEIKSVFEVAGAQLQSELDLYVFIPKNFELTSWNKDDLQSDIRSRMRLSIPTSDDAGLKSIDRGVNELADLLAQDPTSQLAQDRIKEIGAFFGETLKVLLQQHRRHFFLAHGLHVEEVIALKSLRDLLGLIASVGSMVQSTRAKLFFGEYETPDLFLLDEYLSQLYVQYLSGLRFEFDRMCLTLPRTSTHAYQEIRFQLEERLDGLQKAEATYRHQRLGVDYLLADDVGQEAQVVRQSQLKKLFQSKMFIEISRSPAAKHLVQTTAFVGTAFGGLVASVVQTASQPTMTSLTSGGLVVLVFGVLMYVLRDRVKDWAKAKLHRKARQLVPDFEQVLQADEKKLGSVKEWLRLRVPQNLPAHILSHRYLSSNLERSLPEDVLHYRKVQEIRTQKNERIGQHWSVHENIRLNLERYLKHMDDPVKELTLLDHEGRFERRKTRRVYYFYVGVQVTFYDVDASLKDFILPKAKTLRFPSRQTQMYRVVIDKNGIDRVEPISRNEGHLAVTHTMQGWASP